MSERFRLLEFTQVTKARQVDEEKGILHDLVALGPVSANGRDYPERTMQAALPLFEGRQSFANHTKKPGEEPSVYDALGVWSECRVEGGKVRGDFHYFKTHPLAPRLVEAARRPELAGVFGFSINAQGTSRRQGDRRVIESIDELSSIDCVSRPATTKGFYESLENPPVTKKLKDLIESLKTTRPGYAKALREMAESGILAPDSDVAEPAAVDPVPDEGGDHEEALKNGFAAACAAVLADDGMDLKAKLARLKEILTAQEKLLGGDTPAETPAAEKGPDVAESRRLKLENIGLKLLLEAGIAKPGKVLTKALAGCADEAEMKGLIAEAKTAPAPRPGARSAPAGGTQIQEGKAPEDSKQLGRWLRE